MRLGPLRALALAAGLVGWSATAGLSIPGRRHPLLQAALAVGLVTLARAPVGLRPPALWVGVRVGLTASAAIVAGFVAVGAHPRVRAEMADRDLPARPATWLALQIPLGTVWSEEAAYRGALGKLAADAFGARIGRLLQASAFGLSHIYDARVTGAPAVPTVIATAGAGWFFAWLADRSGSLAAPVLAHLAINETGAAAALAVQARARRAAARG